LGDYLAKLKELDRTTLVLASTSDQRIILEAYANSGLFFGFKLKHFRFLDPHTSGDYLYYLKMKYNIDPSVADSLVEIYSQIDVALSSEFSKINLLTEIKNDLVVSGKLSFVDLSQHECKKIILINRNFVSNLPSNLPVETLYLADPVNNPVFKVESTNKEEEYGHILKHVIQLIESSVGLNQIRILNTTCIDEYQLNKCFKAAGIPLAIKKSQILSKHPIAIEFMRLAETDSLETTIDWLLGMDYTGARQNEAVAKKIIQIINDYSVDELTDNLDLLQYELDKATYLPPLYSCAVTISDILDLDFDTNNHYLVLNANDEALPVKAIDNDYLSDHEKIKIGIPSSIESNILKTKELEALFSRVNNLTFFFAKTESEIERRFAELELSRQILDAYNFYSPSMVTYHPKLDILAYAKMRYKLETYGVETEGYARFDATFKDAFSYYDPQFQGLTKSTIEKLIANRIHISASSLKLFNECPFHFLLDQLLKINPGENTLPIFFGNLTHKILDMLATNPDVDIDQLIMDEANHFPEEIAYKKDVFINIYTRQIKIVVDYLSDFEQNTRFKVLGNEWNYSYPYELDSRFVITGKIDKILTLEKEEISKTVVIDYKTGNNSFSQDEFEAGGSVQLPFYLHLLRKNPETAHLDPLGFFYQKVQLGRYKYDKQMDPILKILRLNGLIIEDKTAIYDLADEKWLQGIKFKQDGTLARSNRLITKSDMENIMFLTNSFINNAVMKIKAGDFTIKPLPPKKNMRISKSCEYCMNSSICHLQSIRVEVEQSEEEDNDD